MNKWSPVLLLLCIVQACNPNKKPTLFSLTTQSGIHFKNTITESKAFNVFKYRNFYNGGGVATGDLNNDGLPEVFFTANEGANKLYLNKGNFSFQDISLSAGFGAKQQWSTGVVFADVNADGWLDIYVSNAGHLQDSNLRANQLFINNHNLTFTEKAAEFGLDNKGYTTQSSFFDYDLDGDLDCFMVNNSPIPVNVLNNSNLRDQPLKDLDVAEFLKGGGDHLYKNDNGRFTEVSASTGIHGGLISLGLGVTVSDVNTDGWPDIYVSNDFFERDYLYINQQNGTFKDEWEQRSGHMSLSSMGADIQDVNNDGAPDIFTTDMLPSDDYRLKANTSFDGYDIVKLREQNGFYYQFTQNALQVNDGKGRFKETGFYSQVAASDWSWGALLFDADNDGLQDIYVSNGIYRDVTDQDFIDFFANELVQQMVISGKKEEVTAVITRMPSNPIPNNMFRNTGNLKFADEAQNWGLHTPSFSNGAVYADLDNDGDLDLVVNNVNQDAFVYKNNGREQNKHHYLSIQARYRGANLFAIGTTVKVFAGNAIHTREIMPGRGFQSSVDYKQTIGLGTKLADSLHIIWPDQTISSIIKPAVNQTLVVDYAQLNKKAVVQPGINSDSLLTFLPGNLAAHQEDDFADFYFERNIPFMLSKQGPKAAQADVNGDGLPDLFIGGARQQPSQLYLQTPGGYSRKEVPDFKTFAFQDITAAVFLDADKDGDMDLFAGGGGNFATAALGNIQNQLYINDGQGNFTLKRGGLPPSSANCAIALVYDFNKDGAPDIFAFGRSIPQDYGLPAASYIYQNDGTGNFTDVTATIAPNFGQLGMVTGAAFSDLNGDGLPELIVAGEWMAPLCFGWQQQQLKPIANSLEAFKGCWQALAISDVDADGDNDLVLGNLGENFYLQANAANPIKLWIYDFDENGMADKIFSRSINNKDVPVFNKKDITEQIPALKKLNLKHADFAHKTIPQLFAATYQKATVSQINYLTSAVAINNGKGQFVLHPLPLPAQLSSINSLLINDVNGDGFKDIVCGGNFYDLLPQFCRLDASSGAVLLNDGKGGFSADRYSNLHINGQIRDIQVLSKKDDSQLIFLVNNRAPQVYRIQSNTKK
jgi:enediyne biosynthesis protein E4